MRFVSEARRPGVRNRGFTLMEMLIVISVMLVLLAIALPMYNQSILRAREAKLHQNLATLNKAIEEYTLDKKHAPTSPEDLVPGYIKFIPEDITGSTTWCMDQEDPEDSADPNQTGIKGVHSCSDQPSSSGDPYSSWKH